MNTYDLTAKGMVSALSVSKPDRKSARTSATFGNVPPVKWVEDADTGERVGWIRKEGSFIEWSCGTRSGLARNKAEALQKIAAVVIEDRKLRAEHDRWQREIDALPQPLRSLRIEVEHAKVRLEIERCRIVPRPADLIAAEDTYSNAVMAYDAAERAMAEVA